jgi:hypothetical protein
MSFVRVPFWPRPVGSSLALRWCGVWLRRSGGSPQCAANDNADHHNVNDAAASTDPNALGGRWTEGLCRNLCRQ